MTVAYYEYWLSQIPYVGSATIHKLLRRYGTAEQIYRASAAEMEENKLLTGRQLTSLERARSAKAQQNVYKGLELMQRQNIRLITSQSPSYPESLRHIASPPYSLFVKGNLPDQHRPCLAVVGGRTTSYAARSFATKIGRELAEHGIAVVSGLARGIDVASQQGVLSIPGGITYGILGCGIDQCYPEENMEPYMLMQQQGGVISEFAPGVRPVASNFPMRNRLISGLSQGILVIGARENSGSLITVSHALEEGKDIFVVPGSVWDPEFEASNRLLKEGAVPVTGIRDILDGMGIFVDEDVSSIKGRVIKTLTGEEARIYELLGLSPVHISQICESLQLSVPLVLRGIHGLLCRGIVREEGNHYYTVESELFFTNQKK